MIAGNFHPAYVNPQADPTTVTNYVDGYADRITVSNIIINSPSPDGWSFAGGMIGNSDMVPYRISRSKVTNATITAGNGSGGIIAYNGPVNSDFAEANLWIDHCSSTGSITEAGMGGGAFFGGIAGSMISGDFITNSYSTMTMSSTNVMMGGLVGQLRNSFTNLDTFALVNSYFKGSITTGSNIGSLIGGALYGYDLANVIYLTKNAYEDINPITAYDPAYDTDGILVSNTSTAFTTLTTDWLTPLNFEKWSPASWSISTTSAPQLQY